MSEADTVEAVDEPVTVESLVEDLRALSVEAGDVVLVHSSLSSLGFVAGGAPAVVDALLKTVGDDGTLVMPTHTGYSDPARWSNPAVPDEWEETVRQAMPAYRPAVTPTRKMGAIPECFRNYPEVVRSRHPNVSFAARGAEADAIVADHSYGMSLGEESPLARIYDRDGDVLLLGTDHDTNTSLHLAEYRADYPKEMTTNGGPVVEDGECRWIQYEDEEGDTADFTDLGASFERQFEYAEGTVGAATAKVLPQRELVDFAVEWFEENR